MRRVVVLAAVAFLGVVAWAIVGGTAGSLYAAAAAIALIGLLLPPALKRRRSEIKARVVSYPAANEPLSSHASGHSVARPLPGVRRLAFVRELEARLAAQEDENRVLSERLERNVEALRRANELLAEDRSARDQALIRVEHSLARHRRERALLERQLETMAATIARRSPPERTRAFAAGGPATATRLPKEGIQQHL